MKWFFVLWLSSLPACGGGSTAVKPDAPVQDETSHEAKPDHVPCDPAHPELPCTPETPPEPRLEAKPDHLPCDPAHPELPCTPETPPEL